jgi:cysteine synthase A
VYAEAERLAEATGGHYLDQFTNAERATDWRGNNNIAESIFDQMHDEEFPIPEWIVVGAGTGGTSATIGRFIRYRRDCCTRTSLAVVDPEGSVFAQHWRTGRDDLTARGSRIEGIGRPRVEPSFQRRVIDRMIPVTDRDSFAAARALSADLGKRVGPSTGTNMVGVHALAAEMAAAGQQGSIVSLICDAGERYLDTLYDDAWLAANG